MAQMSGMKAAADPEGYYRVLGVAPAAKHEDIVLAYRGRAKILHPDVPGTGDTDRFMELQAAYEVLGSRKRREAYDRAAAAGPAPDAPDPPEAARPASGAAYGGLDGDEDARRPAGRRRAPPAVWLGLAALAASAGVVGMTRLLDDGGASRTAAVPAVPPPPVAQDPDPGPSAAAAMPDGAPTGYVAPSAATDDATLWRYDAVRRSYVPSGRIAPFAPVQVLRTTQGAGMAEIRQANGRVAYVDAARLVPGDAAAARRADCTFNAGLPPENGEVLRRNARGPYSVTVENRLDTPAVVQLRTATGALTVEAFVAARSLTTLPALPEGVQFVQVASGEFWSRRCSVFTAAMRARRWSASVRVGGAVAPLTIAREDDAADIADAAFSRE